MSPSGPMSKRSYPISSSRFPTSGGGASPVFSSGAAIETLISAFRARLSLAADCEITLEANPGTFEAEKFRGYREAGVNRLSIGIQSFEPKHLKALGRIHDDREARR